MKAAPALGDLGFLASHRGTNVQAVLDACKTGRLGARPAVVIGNNRDAEVLARARRAALPAYHLSAETHPEPEALDRTIRDTLIRHGVGLVVLAGYMKQLGPHTLADYEGRILNVHPSLLPSFRGLRPIERALEHGVKVTGVTVHFVDEGVDTGPVILQEPVPIEPSDTPARLRERIHAVEHRLLPEAVRLYRSGALRS